jgi:hypothetical protein
MLDHARRPTDAAAQFCHASTVARATVAVSNEYERVIRDVAGVAAPALVGAVASMLGEADRRGLERGLIGHHIGSGHGGHVRLTRGLHVAVAALGHVVEDAQHRRTLRVGTLGDRDHEGQHGNSPTMGGHRFAVGDDGAQPIRTRKISR